MRSSLLYNYGKHNINGDKEKDQNAMHLTFSNKAQERWNDKGEINKGPTANNGVRASSLEIHKGIVSKLVTLWTPLQTRAHRECYILYF